MTEAGKNEGPVYTVREAVGVFHDYDELTAAVEDLEEAGFDRSDIDLMASWEAVEKKLGHVYKTVEALEDNPEAPRTAFVARDDVTEGRAALVGGFTYLGAIAAALGIVASGGTLALAIASAVAGGAAAGGIGALISHYLGENFARRLKEQLEHGGLVLWVRLRDAEHERRAVEILRRHGAHDVHVHDIKIEWKPEEPPLGDAHLDPWLVNR